MKFGRVFKERLKSEGFPPDWVESAISYRELKKCIHRLTDELNGLGLDPNTLGRLLKHVEDYNAAQAEAEDDEEKPFEYILSGRDEPDQDAAMEDGYVKRRRKPFHPKLLFYVNEKTGELLSAKLDKETRSKLQMLAVETGMSNVRVFEEPEAEEAESGITAEHWRPGYRTVEVPLTSDSEFFSKLTTELTGLEALQAREEQKLHSQIEELGKQIAKLTNPKDRHNRKLLTAWRQIFQIYVENDIFFGSTETDHAAHSAEKAAERFQNFANTIVEQGLVAKLKKPETAQALSIFMQINQELIQSLRFGEINRTAMTKILKKFDKRTALGVKSTFPLKIAYPEFSEHLAKAVCSEVHNQVLSHVPQIDDYSCPMCTEIKWRPVKLACGHSFCIRCLIIMQSRKQGRCPLCRERTVVDANSENLDEEMAEFLKKWFPEEVKAKQKYNEYMAGVDQYGEVYKEKCVVM